MTSSSSTAIQESRATFVGAAAVVLWAGFASLASLVPAIPALQLTAMIFTVSALASLARWGIKRESPFKHFRLPAAVWALGILGLFGYHVFFFVAVKLAPAVEVNLINYMWPLLIVVFSAFLPGEKLRWYHIAGAGLGFAGILVLIGGKGTLSFSAGFIAGYASAFGCALTWALYSVLSRRFASVPSDSLGAFYFACAALSWILHFLFEESYLPRHAVEWVAVAAIGLGPVGLAFMLWDHGMKRGDVRLLGILSFATPLLSTLLLILVSGGVLSWPIAVATALIACGGVLGAGIFKRGKT